MPPRTHKQRAALRCSASPDLLELQEVVPQLTAAAAHQLGLPGAAVPCSDADLHRVKVAMLSVCEKVSTWNVQNRRIFMADKPLQAALLQLTAVWAHLPVEEHWDEQLQHAALGAPPRPVLDVGTCQLASCIFRGMALLAKQDGRLLPLEPCSTLLRMQLLHAGARQLAAAAAAIRRGRPLPRSPSTLLLWEGVVGLVEVLLCTGLLVPPKASLRIAVQITTLRSHLAEVLASSRVLEHAAQVLVALAERQPPGAPPCTQLASATKSLFDLLEAATILQGKNKLGTQDPPAAGSIAAVPDDAATLVRALQTRCVVHVLLGAGVTALSDLDGGPTHGLEPQLWRRLQGIPLFDGVEAAGDRLTRMKTLVNVLTAFNVDSRRPLRTRATCSLLLRIARLGVGCMGPQQQQQRAAAPTHGPAAAGAGGSAEGGSPLAPRVLLTRAGGAALAEKALSQVGRILSTRLPSAECEGQWLEAWGLLLRYLSCVLDREEDEEEEDEEEEEEGEQEDDAQGGCGTPVLKPYVKSATGDATGLLPPPALAAGLSAGLLPFLERLLRCACGDIAAPHASLLSDAIYVNFRWCPLLTHGPPQQAAAAAVSLRKLVQRAARLPLVGPVGRFSGVAWYNILSSAFDALEDMEQRARAACAASACGSPAGQDDGGAAPQGTAGGGAGGQAAAAAAGQAAAPAGALSSAGAAAQPWLTPPFAFALHQLLPAAAQLLVTTEQQLLPTTDAAGLPCDVWGLLVQVCSSVSFWVQALLLADGGCALVAAYGAVPAVGCPRAEPQAGGCAPGLAPAAAGADAAAGGTAAKEEAGASGWGQLVRGLGPVQLVGAALRFWARAISVTEHFKEYKYTKEVCDGVTATLDAAGSVAGAFPEEVRAALAAAGTRARDGGRAGSRGGGGAALWPLRALVPFLRQQGMRVAAHAAVQLAAHLEGGCRGLRPAACRPPPCGLALPPVSEALALWRRCDNPACVLLAGDSEADAKLLACGKCGAARYCSRGCQVVHWRAEHKEACAGLGSSGAGAGSSAVEQE